MGRGGFSAVGKAASSGNQVERCSSSGGACDWSGELDRHISSVHMRVASSFRDLVDNALAAGKRCDRDGAGGGGRSECRCVDGVEGVARYAFLGFSSTAFPSLARDERACRDRNMLPSRTCTDVTSGRGRARCGKMPHTDGANCARCVRDKPLLGLMYDRSGRMDNGRRSEPLCSCQQCQGQEAHILSNIGVKCNVKESSKPVPSVDVALLWGRLRNFMVNRDDRAVVEDPRPCRCRHCDFDRGLPSCSCGSMLPAEATTLLPSLTKRGNRSSQLSGTDWRKLGPKPTQPTCACTDAPGSKARASSCLAFVEHASQELGTWTSIIMRRKTETQEFEDRQPGGMCESPVLNSKANSSNLLGRGFVLFGVHPVRGSSHRFFSPSAALGFARLQGEPVVPEDGTAQEESAPSAPSAQEGASASPLPKAIDQNMKKLRQSLSGVVFPEFRAPAFPIGKPRQPFPDKKELSSVQDFFQYTRAEGRKLFEELDRDNDGQVTLEDLEATMMKRKLPRRYAKEFLHSTRRQWFSKSFGWTEFLSLMEQRESTMLRAFTSLSISKSGTLQKHQVLASLRSAGLPATEGNAAAMMRCLDADANGTIAYGQFRNFMLLLPPERLEGDPRTAWFEAATVVPLAPPVGIQTGSVLKSALAGGLACALSTCLLHPVDTMKAFLLNVVMLEEVDNALVHSHDSSSVPFTSDFRQSCTTRVQASTLSFSEVLSALPAIGVKGLYRGSIPAIIGQFSSHGLRTGIFEASKMVLRNVAPQISALQAQSLASFCSTILGTAVRIPCEVLKQRLQAGLYDNVGEGIRGTLMRDGWKGFFRGTGATLCREVPFYVAGMGIYEEAKKGLHGVLQRDLEPWETIAVGGVSGGLAAVCTTPFDVLKTRMMTAAPGMPTTMTTIAIAIVQKEGVLALFKGAVPRFFWIAPLGAMNFAGYELAKRAMEKKEQDGVETAGDVKVLEVAHA